MGLITYMRTDSLRIADEAQAAAKEFITGPTARNMCVPRSAPTKQKRHGRAGRPRGGAAHKPPL